MLVRGMILGASAAARRLAGRFTHIEGHSCGVESDGNAVQVYVKQVAVGFESLLSGVVAEHPLQRLDVRTCRHSSNAPAHGAGAVLARRSIISFAHVRECGVD